MKEVIDIAANLIFAAPEKEQKLVPMVELAIISSEPDYELVDGVPQRRRKTHTTRVCIRPESLSKVARALSEIAEQAFSEANKWKKVEDIK